MGIAAFAWVRITGSIVDTKQQFSQTQSRFLGSHIEMFATDTGRYPAELSELTLVHGIAGSKGPYASAKEFIDPWKRPYYYRPTSTDFQLFSLGGDGRMGGEGDAADLANERPRR